MLRTILSISGKPGLYKLISRGKNMLIVEALDGSKKRQPIYSTDKVISLGDIAMYTDNEEVPLNEVLNNVKSKENGNLVQLDTKKVSGKELHDYMSEVLPNYDKDRVYPNDIKKLVSWYNILINNGIKDFTKEENAE